MIDNIDRATYSIEKGGKVFDLVVDSIPYNAEPAYIDAAARLPLYRRNTDAVWFAYMPDANVTYLAFNHYPPVDELKRIAAELFQTLDAHPGGALVIDFRNNGGGDYIEFDRVLLGGLKTRDWLFKRGRLFGLIGRKTFSAAMMNALQLRQQMNSILVGEPTGARPNSYSEAAQFRLPNSKFAVQYSRLYYHLVPGNPSGVIPDKLIPPTWDDYKNGKDSALQWVFLVTRAAH